MQTSKYLLAVAAAALFMGNVDMVEGAVPAADSANNVTFSIAGAPVTFDKTDSVAVLDALTRACKGVAEACIVPLAIHAVHLVGKDHVNDVIEIIRNNYMNPISHLDAYDFDGFVRELPENIAIGVYLDGGNRDKAFDAIRMGLDRDNAQSQIARLQDVEPTTETGRTLKASIMEQLQLMADLK